MAKVFNTYVAVHKDPAETIWFAPGDEVPDWAEDKVGDHVYGETEEVDDVRLTDPENEPDDDDTKWSTINTLPPTGAEVAEAEDVDEVDLDSMKKDELVALAAERGLDTDGTKADLKERILADMDEEEE